MTAVTIAEMYGLRPPRVWTYKGKVDHCINPDLVIGLELETENCSNSEDFYIDIGAKLGIDVKGDGSLREVNGNRAYEFITKPIRSDQALVTIGNFLQLCKFNDENYSDRCSVHVHVNCTDMTFEQVASVGLIYTVVEDILFKFVNERQGNKDGWSRDTNIYCVPWNQCRDHLNLVYRFTKTPERALAGWQKYTALNLLPLQRFGTMEWRHMHGTADMKKISQWLNIIGAIYKHAKATPFEELVKDIQGLNTESNYAKFFDTVLGGQLAYNEEYRQSMSEGCILAKYSMINWSLDKKNPGRFETKKKAGNIWADMVAEVHADINADVANPIERAFAPPVRARDENMVRPTVRPTRANIPRGVIQAGQTEAAPAPRAFEFNWNMEQPPVTPNQVQVNEAIQRERARVEQQRIDGHNEALRRIAARQGQPRF